jgi:hypothetical protein
MVDSPFRLHKPKPKRLPIYTPARSGRLNLLLSGVLGFALDSPRDDPLKVQQVAHALISPASLVANSSLPGYGRIWRIPVTFTINRERPTDRQRLER